MKKLFLVFPFLLFVLWGHCFEGENNVCEINDQVIELLIKVKDPAIILSDGHSKTYLDLEKMISRENGLFLQTQNGDEFRVPVLFSDEKGCYVLSSNPNNSTVYPIIQCRRCERPFSPNVFNKGICPSLWNSKLIFWRGKLLFRN